MSTSNKSDVTPEAAITEYHDASTTASQEPFHSWPGTGLRAIKRRITGHDEAGKSVFVSDDIGDHYGGFVPGAAVTNALYSTKSVPVDINGQADVQWAKENKPDVIVPNGSLLRMIDFAPGAASELHRSLAIVYAVVIQGEFEISLDSGEKKLLLPGDVVINRSAMHAWRNTSGTEPGRMLYMLLDVEPVFVNEKKLEFDLGELSKAYN